MPLDGIVLRSLCTELNNLLSGGRIEKIFQPEKDKVIIHVHSRADNYKLLLNAGSSHPRIHLTDTPGENPPTPPNFCMLLRKHLSGGRIRDINQHDFERIVEIRIDSINELGDPAVKKLIIEIMGRHSNIILADAADKIIDSVKRIDKELSRVREVMPGRLYVHPPSQNKIPPDIIDLSSIKDAGPLPDDPVGKFLLDSIMGFSPLVCAELCRRAGIDETKKMNQVDAKDITGLQRQLERINADICENRFFPNLITDISGNYLDFYCFKLEVYSGYRLLEADSINRALDVFFTEKDRIEKVKQKKAELSKSVASAISKCEKSLSVHQDKLKEAADYDTYRVYGELIFANIHNIKPGQSEVSVYNYYGSGNGPLSHSSSITIPLDENLSPQQNASRYFRMYNKAKNALSAVNSQLQKAQSELEYLEGVLQSIQNCDDLRELEEIQKELQEQNIIPQRRRATAKKTGKPSSPMKFISSDGFTILLGKNNRQNDALTTGGSSREDIWFHAQKIPGSHVVVRTEGRPVPDSTLLEAAMLAAYYSKARNSGSVPVDYTRIKYVKKPPGAKPGMVIYNNFETLIATPDKEKVERLANRINGM